MRAGEKLLNALFIFLEHVKTWNLTLTTHSRSCFFKVLVVQCQNSIKYILLRIRNFSRQDTDTFQVNSASSSPNSTRSIDPFVPAKSTYYSWSSKTSLAISTNLTDSSASLLNLVSQLQMSAMDEFTAPSMDWTTPGDLHKRFKIFKQKCNLIFDGPLENQAQDKKARLLLLWASDKGFEIYNTATWSSEEDQLKRKPIF